MSHLIDQFQRAISRIVRVDIRRWWHSRTQGSDRDHNTGPLDLPKFDFHRLTLEQFSQEILKIVQGKIAVSTQILYGFSLQAFIRVVGNVPIAALGAYHFELFLACRLNEVSAVRVNIEFRALKALFQRAAMYGMVPSNPMSGLKQIRVPYENPRAISPQEFARLLSVIRSREFRALVILAVCTAMRADEISSLRWQDVDLVRGVIHLVNREGFRLKGLRPRDVPLSRRATLILRALPRRGLNVFVTTRGRPYTPHALTVRFKEYVRLAKLPEEIHLHSLRHTGASLMVERNVPLPYIQEILGHASINTTMMYTHSTSDHLRNSVKMVDPLGAL